MRGSFALTAGIVGFVGFGIPLARSADTPRRATVTVNVDVQCQGSRVEFSVDPWVARLQQGDDVEWRLADNADSDTITVAPKQGRAWPFVAAAPGGSRANAARSGNMRPNQRGRHQYNITLVCQQGNSGPYTVVIDPDMDIN